MNTKQVASTELAQRAAEEDPGLSPPLTPQQIENQKGAWEALTEEWFQQLVEMNGGSPGDLTFTRVQDEAARAAEQNAQPLRQDSPQPVGRHPGSARTTPMPAPAPEPEVVLLSDSDSDDAGTYVSDTLVWSLACEQGNAPHCLA